MNLKKLEKEQLELARKVITKDSFKKITYIASCDQAFKDNIIFSVILVFDYESLTVLEKKDSKLKAKIPYIPGYLSFREAPSIVAAYKKLKIKPDLLLVDANGILHPRRIGMDSHIGILLDIPTIGVAKSLLCGKTKGNKVIVNNEIRAIQLSTKKGCNPIYVSPGHRVSLKTSVKIVRKLVKDHKLPEPLRLAHLFVSELTNVK